MNELNDYRGKRVLVTGHTGFKGGWLTCWLLESGADVAGYALAPPTDPNFFDAIDLRDQIRHRTGDVRDADRLADILAQERPEIVFHLAAQPLVRESYRTPKETFDVNIGGTVNLLEAVRHCDSVGAVVVVTTDKCYENRDWVWGYRENDRLGGHDPYSASKAAAEIVVASYRDSFFSPSSDAARRPGVATVRAGNVVGGGDWAADRILPDCVRSLVADTPITVRRPEAVRPWQHVIEPLYGYLLLGLRLLEAPARFAGPWNFGPSASSCRPVGEVAEMVVSAWGSGSWQAERQEDSMRFHESNLLQLCIDQAVARLGWQPRWDLRETIDRTIEWYREHHAGAGSDAPRDLIRRQIDEYPGAGDPPFEAPDAARDSTR